MLEFLLALIPLLLLLVALLLGHYPGVEAIVWLATRIASVPPARAAQSQPCPCRPHPHAVSGGLLLAFGLAQRPPPLAP